MLQIKEEPLDESQCFVPALAPSQGLIEFFLDNEYKKEEFGYVYNKVKYLDEASGPLKMFTDVSSNQFKLPQEGDFENYCDNCDIHFDSLSAAQNHHLVTHPESSCLDETDGKFKNFADVSSNQSKFCQEGDFKNYCHKCDKHFDNLSAAQNHYLFNHPDSSLLASTVPRTYQGITQRNRNYNWLDEPIRIKEPIKKKEESNIIIVKDQQEYLKKLSFTKKLVQMPKNVLNPNPDQKYTLENIKIHPLQGIKVVKKSDLPFNVLRTKSGKKLIVNTRPVHQAAVVSSKRTTQQGRQLVKIDIKEAFIATPKLKLFKKFLEPKSEKTIPKYFCKDCDFEMFDPLVFDGHMRQHMSATFRCAGCRRRFCTKIGIMKHVELCKKN